MGGLLGVVVVYDPPASRCAAPPPFQFPLREGEEEGFCGGLAFSLDGGGYARSHDLRECDGVAAGATVWRLESR